MRNVIHQQLFRLGWRLPILLEIDDHYLSTDGDGVMTIPSEHLLSLSNLFRNNYNNQAKRIVSAPKFLLLTDQRVDFCESLTIASPSQYKTFLGQEFDGVVIDAIDSLPASATAALAGCIKAGGLMVIIGSRAKQWIGRQVKESIRLFDKRIHSSAFIERVLSHFCSIEEFAVNKKMGVKIIVEHKSTFEQAAKEKVNDAMDKLSKILSEENLEKNYTAPKATLFNSYTEQRIAILAIEKVFTGHAKRHLVLTSDRGRGKSSALAKAASNLVANNNKRLAITSNSRDSILILQRWIDQFLTVDERQQISIYSPDHVFKKLISDNFSYDGLIVDEAAQFPAYWLELFTRKCNRICFATTVHGYEGTGRGFSLRFLPKLFDIAPQSKQLTLDQPIRWSDSDILEEWSNKVFAYKDASLPKLKRADLVTNRLKRIWVNPGEQLSEKRALEAFQLLVDSHYQTTPDDFRQLLDHPNRYLVIATIDSKPVAVSMIIEEGLTDQALMQDIRAGKRRLKGHLVSQALAVYSNQPQLALEKSWRIQRIAVQQEYRRQQLATNMLEMVKQEAAKRAIHFLSCSFALTQDLMTFWRKLGFSSVKIGLKKDRVTGSHNLMMVRVIVNNPAWHAVYKQFTERTQALLNSSLRGIPASLSMDLIKDDLVRDISSECRAEIEHYLSSTLPLDEVAYAIRGLLAIANARNYRSQGSNALPLLWAKLIQCKDPEDLAIEFYLTGKKQIEREYRMAVSEIYGWYSLNESSEA